jgi:SMODS and SLOG-associating 2TM effector domain 1/SMODS and SLOG-associating 2TM effector domain 3
MEEIYYPALYRASNKAAKNAQRRHFAYIRSYSYLLISAACIGIYGIEDSVAAAGAALLMIGGIFISILMILKKEEDVWYRTRAVAESVKTSAWRFMMRGEPYTDAVSTEIVNKELRGRLRKILCDHKDLSLELGGEISGEEQISEHMCEVRNQPLNERIRYYLKYRIDEQRKWYAGKSDDNRKRSQFWFTILISCQTIAVILVVLRIVYPAWRIWPTEGFVVAAGAVLTWIQTKRFRELASSYGLTAHEIGILRGELKEISEESQFAQFVTDSENAFSREHTQWLARKDIF